MNKHYKNKDRDVYYKILTSEDGVGKLLKVSKSVRSLEIKIGWYECGDLKFYDEISADEFWGIYYDTIANFNREIENCSAEITPDREVIAEIGPDFIKWARVYVPENINKEIQLSKILYDCMASSVNLRSLSSKAFKRKLELWCNQNDFVLKDRILRNLKVPGFEASIPFNKTIEFIQLSPKVTVLH